MAEFLYKAIGSSGGQTDGRVEGADRKSVVAMLAERGEFVTDLKEAGDADDSVQVEGQKVSFDLSRFRGGRVGVKDILAFTKQLSAALRAGLPLLNALQILHKQQHKTAMKGLLEDIVSGVNAGESLSQTMEKHPKVFSRLYISMIRVGETGGILEQTTEQLADILAREVTVKTNMKNASAYPLFVLVVGLISVVVVITWVLPGIIATVTEGNAVLPWPTRFLLGMSDFIKNFGIVALAAGAAGFFFFWKWIHGEGRIKFDAFKLRILVLGSVLRTIAVGRFAKTLGALTKGGVTILDSLEIVRDTLGNEFLAIQIDKVAEKVKTGASVAEPLEDCGYFPPLLVQIVAMGEQTGKLDELLLDAADAFNEQADAAIARFLAVFPAFLILMLALVVVFIVAATLLPIVTMGLGGGVI